MNKNVGSVWKCLIVLFFLVGCMTGYEGQVGFFEVDSYSIETVDGHSYTDDVVIVGGKEFFPLPSGKHTIVFKVIPPAHPRLPVRVIKRVVVTPGEKYWLSIVGSSFENAQGLDQVDLCEGRAMATNW